MMLFDKHYTNIYVNDDVLYDNDKYTIVSIDHHHLQLSNDKCERTIEVKNNDVLQEIEVYIDPASYEDDGGLFDCMG